MAGAFQAGSIVATLTLDTKAFRRAANRVLNTAKEVARGVTRFFKNVTFGSVTRGLSALGRSFRALRARLTGLQGLFAAFGASLATFSLIQRAQDVEALRKSFDSLSRSIGAVSDDFLQRLRVATRGAVSDLQLMRATNSAILLGVAQSAEGFAELASVARRLGSAVGRTTTQALEDLSVGIGRQSRLILDNLGLIVSVEKANRLYAQQLGKTANELTDSERRQAFFNATMEAAREKIASLGDDTLSLAEKYGRFTAQLGALVNTIAVQFVGGGSVFVELGNIIQDNIEKIRDLARFAARVTRSIVSSVAGIFSDIFSAQSKQEFIRALTDFVGDALQFLFRFILQLLSTFIEALFTDLAGSIANLITSIFLQISIRIGAELKKLVAEIKKEAQGLFEFIEFLFGDRSGTEALADAIASSLTGGSGVSGMRRAEAEYKASIERIEAEQKEAAARIRSLTEFEIDNISRKLGELGTNAARDLESDLGNIAANRFANAWNRAAERVRTNLESLRLDFADPFTGFNTLTVQSEIQNLADIFNDIIELRQQAIADAPDIIREEDLRESSARLKKLQEEIIRVSNALNKLRTATGETRTEIELDLRQSVSALEVNLLRAGLEAEGLGDRLADTATIGEDAVTRISDRLQALQTSLRAAFDPNAAIEAALAPQFLNAREFEEIIAPFEARLPKLTLEIQTIGLSETGKALAEFDAAFQGVRNQLSPEQLRRFKDLRQELRLILQQRQNVKDLVEIEKAFASLNQQINQTYDDLTTRIVDNREALADLGRREIDQDIAAINREYEDLSRSVYSAVAALADQAAAAGASSETIEFYGEKLREVREVLDDLRNVELGQAIDRRLQERLKAVSESLASSIRTNIGGAILDAFERGESVLKNFAEIGAGFFRDQFNQALDFLQKKLSSVFFDLFKDSAAGAAGGAIAQGLLGIGGALLNAASSRTTSSVDDFESAISSSESVRGVVAGPTNVAVSRVGSALKEALRTTEVLLERIAIAVETGGSGGFRIGSSLPPGAATQLSPSSPR